jgi:hypothetical protein
MSPSSRDFQRKAYAQRIDASVNAAKLQGKRSSSITESKAGATDALGDDVFSIMRMVVLLDAAMNVFCFRCQVSSGQSIV